MLVRADRTLPELTAFAVQYTAIVLILLTFVAGAMTGPRSSLQEVVVKEPAPSNPQLVAPRPIRAVFKPIKVLSLNKLFHQEQVKKEILAPYIEILKAHDLIARIEVFNAPRKGSSSYSRSITLTRYLLSEKVPMHAFQVLARERVSRREARLTMWRRLRSYEQ